MKLARTNARNRFNDALMISAVAVLAFASSPAHAQSYGVNFVGGNIGAGGVGGTVNPANMVGVVPITGFTNVAGVNAAAQTINSSDGTASATFNLTSTAGTATYENNLANDGSNSSLMAGYIDDGAGHSSTAAVSGLTAGQAFDVYVYFQGDGIRPGNGGDKLPNYSVNGTLLYTASEAPAAPFTLAGTQTTNSSAFPGTNPPPPTYGDYIEFPGVVATGGNITIIAGSDTTSFRSPFNGFELVAVVPEPSSLVLMCLGMAALGLFAYRRVMAWV